MSWFSNVIKDLSSAVKKYGGGVLASTGIPGLSGLGSAMVADEGSKEQQKNNLEIQANNIALQRETNQSQIDLAREINQQSLDFQKQMFDLTNEYNTPQKQVARLLAAGINPYNDGQSGALQSGVGDMPSTPGQSVPQLTAPRNDYVDNTFDSAMHGLLALSQSSNLQADTDFKIASFEQRMRQAFYEADTAEYGSYAQQYAANIAQLNYNLLNSTYDNQIKKSYLENDLINENIRSLAASAARDNAEASWLEIQPYFKSQELGLKQQEVNNIAKEMILQYEVGMANVSAQNFATSVHQQLGNEQNRIMDFESKTKRGEALNAAFARLSQLRLNQGELNVAKGQLNHAADVLDWEKSWKHWFMTTSSSLINTATLGLGLLGKSSITQHGAAKRIKMKADNKRYKTRTVVTDHKGNKTTIDNSYRSPNQYKK